MNNQRFYDSLKSGMKVRLRKDLFTNPICKTSSRGFEIKYYAKIKADWEVHCGLEKFLGQVVTLKTHDSASCRWSIVGDEMGWFLPDTAFIPLHSGFNKLLESGGEG